MIFRNQEDISAFLPVEKQDVFLHARYWPIASSSRIDLNLFSIIVAQNLRIYFFLPPVDIWVAFLRRINGRCTDNTRERVNVYTNLHLREL